jgi:hypothetical protein
MDGDFGDASDNEDVFVPQFVIPRKQIMAESASMNRRPLSQSQSPRPPGGGGGPKKVEKYDLSTGVVLAVYDNQSKVGCHVCMCGVRVSL